MVSVFEITHRRRIIINGAVPIAIFRKMLFTLYARKYCAAEETMRQY